MFNKSAIMLAFAFMISILNYSYIPEKITGNVWEPKVWNLDNGSYSKFDNGTFQAAAIKQIDTDFGSASVQQGNMPHKWYNSSAKLIKEITIDKDDNQKLYLIAKVNRLTAINWTGNDTSKRWNNIGIDIMGDVGLDYYNPDISKPHALIIDLYHDTDAIYPFYQTGAIPHDNDYRAGYPLNPTRLGIGAEYAFKTRIDDKIRDALNYYGFKNITIKYIEYYIEAKASSSSMQVKDISVVKE